MDKENFFKILCSFTPQELNEFISKKGKQKMVNAVTFGDKSKENNKDKENTKLC